MWRFIAVLVSTCPLSEAAALQLYRIARRLYDDDQDKQSIYGDIMAGEVRFLRQHAAMGALTGPVFEADVDVGGRSGVVRFLVTPAGLEEPDPSWAERKTEPALVN